MFKCYKCKGKIQGLSELVSYSLNNCLCNKCLKKQREERMNELKEEIKKEEIREMLTKRGFIQGFYDENLISAIVKNNIRENKLDEFLKSYEEEKLIELEATKIRERQKQLKIREEAEKKVFGNNSKKKRIPLSLSEQEAILDKYNHECVFCGTEEGLHIHHKDSNPQNNQLNNLIVICGVCHKKLHMKVR